MEKKKSVNCSECHELCWSGQVYGFICIERVKFGWENWVH